MEFIRVFDNDSDYLSYRNGTEYIRPNVSLSKDTNKVFYNYPIWETNGEPFVDLDLPSGTLWAAMNVGASDPSDDGLYFQWGDTSGYAADQVGTGEGKKKFASDYSDYKWHLSGSGVDVKFKKYTTNGATLELEDDAAHVNMGGDWHMPTPNQIKELINNTTRKWTTLDSVKGMTFTSKKDTSKSIFIPAAGWALDGSVGRVGDFGHVWSSMLTPDGVNYCDNLLFSSGNAYLNSILRNSGLSMRGVLG